MNKMELVAAMAAKAGLTKVDAEKALEAFVETVTEELTAKEEVRLVGFGTFAVSERKESEGRNPKTGEPITIPAKFIPKFKPGKLLKDSVA